MCSAPTLWCIFLDITNNYYNIYRLIPLGFKGNPPLLQKKLTQDLVAGHPKSVIRQQMGVKPRNVPMHLKGATAALTRNIPGSRYLVKAL
jgi:hypothetical protein